MASVHFFEIETLVCPFHEQIKQVSACFRVLILVPIYSCKTNEYKVDYSSMFRLWLCMRHVCINHDDRMMFNRWTCKQILKATYQMLCISKNKNNGILSVLSTQKGNELLYYEYHVCLKMTWDQWKFFIDVFCLQFCFCEVFEIIYAC